MKKWLSLGLCLSLLFTFLLAFASCGKKEADKTPINPEEYTVSSDVTDLVKMNVKTASGIEGSFYIRLYPDYAPETVKNFQNLVKENFYNGLTFHRLIPGFCLQGGDPKGNGTGGSDKEIKGEFAENGVDNPLSHLTGVISMARSMNPNSASSQFFFVLSDNYTSSLDGKYAAFGYIVSGLELLDTLGKLDTNMADRPLDTVTVVSCEFAVKK